jgi:uncharacterized protein (DUF924 family)
MTTTPNDIIDFWFSEPIQPQWFSASPALDKDITDRYLAVWERAAQHGYDDWCDTPLGSLALVIVLDQFPLNMFRNQAKSFCTEQMALEVARRAIDNQQDRLIPKDQLAFLYMPFMHSESMADQDRSVDLYRAANLVKTIRFAEHHRDIVQRFGRFPHRNAILSRPSSADELAYLASDQAFTG